MCLKKISLLMAEKGILHSAEGQFHTKQHNGIIWGIQCNKWHLYTIYLMVMTCFWPNLHKALIFVCFNEWKTDRCTPFSSYCSVYNILSQDIFSSHRCIKIYFLQTEKSKCLLSWYCMTSGHWPYKALELPLVLNHQITNNIPSFIW